MNKIFKASLAICVIIILWGTWHLTRKNETGQMRITSNFYKTAMSVSARIQEQAAGKMQLPPGSHITFDANSLSSPDNPFNASFIPFSNLEPGNEDYDNLTFETEGLPAELLLESALQQGYDDPNDIPRIFTTHTAPNPAMEAELMTAVSANNLEEVRRLLTAGASANSSDNATSATPLFVAISNNNPDMVAVLLQYGALNSQVNDKGFMPIHEIARGDAYGNDVTFRGNEMMDMLIRNGANVDQKNLFGQTALMLASKHKKPETVRFLISKGADKSILDPAGKDALTIATESDCKECVNILLTESETPMEGI